METFPFEFLAIQSFPCMIRIAPAAALAVLVLAAGCGETPTPPQPGTPPTPTTVELVVDGPRSGTVGRQVGEVAVRVRDQEGRPMVGVQVTWEPGGDGTATPAASTTNTSGEAVSRWTLGTAAGEQRLRASVSPQVALEILALAAPDEPETISLGMDTLRIDRIGEAVPLEAVVRDRYGNRISTLPVGWYHGPGIVATVSAQGVVTTASAGVAAIRAWVQRPGGSSIIGEVTIISRETIGPGGGTVVAYGGRVRLDVPPGAVSSATVIGIAGESTYDWEPYHEPEGEDAAAIFRLTPGTLLFQLPARLEIDYEPERIRGWYCGRRPIVLLEFRGGFDRVPGSGRIEGRHRVAGDVTRPGIYAPGCDVWEQEPLD